MTIRVWIWVLVLAVLFVSPGWAALDQEEKAKIDTLSETLKLTPEQKSKVMQERDKSKAELVILEKKWQTLHDQLRQEVRSRKPDQAQVDRLSAELGKVRGDIISLRTNSLLYLKSILTPQQQELIENAQPASGQIKPGK